MFLLPTWMSNLKPSPDMTSSTTSEAVTMTTSSASSSSPHPPSLSHPESAFAAYKAMNDTVAAAATTGFLSLHPHPPPPTTLQSSILEQTASLQRSLWQKLLPPDAISAAAAVAAAVGSHPGPTHSTWNQDIFSSSHHYANSGGAFSDLPMDGGGVGAGGGFPRSKNGARESTGTLKAWLCRNLKNPYPSKGEKIMLAIITRMTLTQVSTWFANARRRLKKERTFRWTVDDDDDDDDYSDEYNNDDDDDDDGRDDNELQLLDDDDDADDDDESMAMNRSRGLKRNRSESRDNNFCASKRRRYEDRSKLKKRKRSGQTEAQTAEDAGPLRSLTLTDSRVEDGDGNKPLSSPPGSLISSSSSSPSLSLPSSTLPRCCSNGHTSNQQVALDDTKRIDVAPSGSVCCNQTQMAVDTAAAATAVDLSTTSKTNTTTASSLSSSSSSSSSTSASTSVSTSSATSAKPRIWSIVEIATT